MSRDIVYDMMSMHTLPSSFVLTGLEVLLYISMHILFAMLWIGHISTSHQPVSNAIPYHQSICRLFSVFRFYAFHSYLLHNSRQLKLQRTNDQCPLQLSILLMSSYYQRFCSFHLRRFCTLVLNLLVAPTSCWYTNCEQESLDTFVRMSW